MNATRCLVLGLFLAACGGDPPPPAAAPEPAPAPAPEPPPPPPPPPIAVAPMKLTPPKGKKAKAVEVKDDGSVMLDGKPVAKFVDNTLVDDAGKAIATVAPDGAVTIADGSTAKFGENDVFTVGTSTIVVNDDGTIKITKDGKEDKTAIGKFEGFAPKGRRAAALVLVAIVTAKPPAPADAKAPPKK